MNKLAFIFLSCSLLNCLFALDITKAKNSFTWHNHAITQKISCIEKQELKSKFNEEMEKGKSLQISHLIALTRTGLPTNATCEGLGISGLNDKYIDLMRAKDVEELAGKIGKDTIKNWNVSNESDAKKLNTFFGFACAINARKKTFSWKDMNESIRTTIKTLNLNKLQNYSNHLTNNLWNAFNSWEIHALDHVLREEKNGVQNSRALTNAQNSCFFNASMQAVYACKPLRDFITKDLKDNKDPFVAALRAFLNEMNAETGVAAVDTGIRGSKGNGLAYNVLQYITTKKDWDVKLKRHKTEYRWSDQCTQEDSHEFLHHVIDEIHNALERNVVDQICKIIKLSTGTGKSDAHYNSIYSTYMKVIHKDDAYCCPDEQIKMKISSNTGVLNGSKDLDSAFKLVKSFEDLIYSNYHCTVTVGCTEKCKSQRSDKASIIEIEIAEGNSVQKLFTHKLKETEKIDSYRCEKCDITAESTKTICITNQSRILPISLQRFKYDGKKDSKLIVPNQILCVYDYINKKSYRYILNSVIVHLGTTGGGHYYAYQRVGNTLQKKDDAQAVTLVDNIPDDTKNGYVFFYERLDEATL